MPISGTLGDAGEHDVHDANFSNQQADGGDEATAMQALRIAVVIFSDTAFERQG